MTKEEIRQFAKLIDKAHFYVKAYPLYYTLHNELVSDFKYVCKRGHERHFRTLEAVQNFCKSVGINRFMVDL